MEEVILSRSEIMSLALFAKKLKNNDLIVVTQTHDSGIGIGTTAMVKGNNKLSKDITDYSLW